MQHEDMRKYVRIDQEMVVSVTERHVSKEEENRVETTCRNLGEGGVFIEMQNPPPKGTIVEIEFVPPHAQKPIKTLGLVRWNTTEPPTPGMGIRFAPVDESERENLLNLVRRAKTEPENQEEE